jgi:hypothetical protein
MVSLGGRQLAAGTSREMLPVRLKGALEKHPWYANQWQARLQDVPVVERDLVLFMQASRWADDIRTQDKAQSRPSWHYINLPFKPEGQPQAGEDNIAAATRVAAAAHFIFLAGQFVSSSGWT